MLYDDHLEDELPEVPVYAPPRRPVADTQEQRLERLEHELRSLRADMQRNSSNSSSRVRATPSPPSTAADEKSADEKPADDKATMTTSSSSPVQPDDAADAAIDCELRRAVSHLSPSFTCSKRDALLLLAAIRRGGDAYACGSGGCGTTGSGSSGVSIMGAGGGGGTLADKLQALAAEHRALEQRLERKNEECDMLRDELAGARQRLQATQEHARQRAALLSQRSEELRRQLLLEETRTEKMHVRNSALERDNARLKARLHDQLR